MPKMIERCIECAHYSRKSHKCMVCKNKETDPRAPFFDDCPLPDAEPVRHGTWEYQPETINTKSGYKCTVCKSTLWHSPDVPQAFKRCPDCGAKMDGDVRDEG